LDQGQTQVNGPHQGAWIELKSGESWFIHFQDRGAYGRIVHLQPMRWLNDWPVIGIDKDGDGKGEPVAVYKKPNVGGSIRLAFRKLRMSSLFTVWLLNGSGTPTVIAPGLL